MHVNRSHKGACCLFTLATAAVLSMGQSLPPEVVAYADMVLYNGKVITADDSFTVAEAAAIRDGKFLAVGAKDRILAMAGPKTRRIDLRGRSVVPGFMDTHLHQAFVGNSASDLSVKCQAVDSCLQELKEIVQKAKPGQTLPVSATSNKVTVDELNASLLDTVSPNNPLWVESQNDQTVVNSLVLKQIPPGTPGILKDKDGKPTGQLRIGAIGVVVYELEPWPDLEKMAAAQKTELKRYNEQGLTTVMGLARGLSITIFRDLMMRNELTARVRVAHEFLRQNPTPEPYLKRIGNLTGFGNDMLKIIGTTVQVVDGSTGTGSGLTSFGKIFQNPLDPYTPFGQNKWTESGELELSDRRNIILANRYGWTITSLHSSGDMSTATLLDVFEEANKERPLSGRHFGIDHNMMIRPEDFKRFKAMDIIPSIYSKAIYGNDSLIKMYGMDRVNSFQPVRSFIDAGVRPVAEADSGPPDSAPLFNIQRWITRTDEKGRSINAREKASRQEALYMYTRWAARYSGEENILGSIEAGKLADFAILGGDYMTFPETDLDKLRVVMTVLGGKVVHEVAGAF